MSEMAMQAQPAKIRPAHMLIDALAQEVSSLEKSVVSLADAMTAHLSDSYPEPMEAEDIKYPGGSSSVSGKLRELCLRVERASRQLDDLRNRTEF